jgi:hypothetical protein
MAASDSATNGSQRLETVAEQSYTQPIYMIYLDIKNSRGWHGICNSFLVQRRWRQDDPRLADRQRFRRLEAQ